MGKEVKIRRSPGKQRVKARGVLFPNANPVPVESSLVRGKRSAWAQSWTGLGANPQAATFADYDPGKVH